MLDYSTMSIKGEVMLNSLKIRSKILLLPIFSLLLFSLAIGIYSVTTMKETLIEKNYSLLKSSNNIKKSQVLAFFDERMKNIKVLAQSPVVKSISSHPEHITKDELAYIQGFVDSYDYKNIFIVDQVGELFYASSKSKNLNKNLNSKELAGSAIASAWKKSDKTKRTVISDLSVIEHFDKEPTLYIATPVNLSGSKSGNVIIVPVRQDKINDIMFSRLDYSETHEDYLIGSDKLLRSDSYLNKDLTVSASLSNKIQVDTEASQNILKGYSGTKIMLDYRGKEVLSAYAPVTIGEDLSWGIISEIDYAEVLAAPQQLQRGFIVLTVVTLLLVIAVTVVLVNRSILEPFYKFNEGLKDFFDFLNNEKGNIAPVEVYNQDEIGTMANDLNKSIAKMVETTLHNRAFIDQSVEIVQNAQNGYFDKRITITTENRTFKQLSQAINEIMDISAKTVDDIGTTLSQLTKGDLNASLQLEAVGTYKIIHDSMDTLIDKLKDDRITTWINEGVSALNKELSTLKSKEDVAKMSISFICEYLTSSIGALYLNDDKEQRLRLLQTYAGSRAGVLSDTYDYGEGVVGEVALSKRPILLEKAPAQEQILIDTACTKQSPLSTYTYPVMQYDTLVAVIELAFIQHLDDAQKSFLHEAGKVIAVSILTAVKNEELSLLYVKTNDANAELEEANAHMEEQQQQLEEANSHMEEQQQQLEEANAHMEEQQQLLLTKQSEIKEKSSELQQKVQELEDVGNYKSEFLANMSHELRTPLNSIILLSSLLSKNNNNKLEEAQVQQAATIHTSAQELLRLINDVLDISKVESGHMEVHPVNFLLEELMDEMKGLFSAQALNKGLDLIIQGDGRKTYRGDKNKISQILRNLLSNALKFTHSGNVVLSFEEGSALSFRVKDDGVGISEDKLSSVFERFKQVDGSISRQYGGTGLGLSISAEMCKLMGGDIRVESKEGQGSTFFVTLPDVLEISSSEAGGLSELWAKNKTLSSSEKAMLIIEDDESSAKFYYEVVSNYGLNCFVALTAKEGLDIIAENNIQGILLDMGLPDMNGLDVIKILKSKHETKDIPIHIISAHDKEEEWDELGVEGYSQKPVDELEIEHALSALLQDVKEGKNRYSNDIDDISLKGYKVCIVDDDVKNIYVLDALLKAYDADVTIAYNGEEALAVLNKEPDIDILLMDIMMPVMDGYEAIEKIRKNVKTKDIPIIVTTAKAMKGEKEKCIDLGADDYISKPLDERLLLKMISAWCEKRR